MAGELRQTTVSGVTVYAVLFSGATIWTGGNTFTAPTAALMNANVVVMTEISGTGIYLGTFPAGITTAGRYFALIFQQSGSTPNVVNDQKLGASPQLDWNGSALDTIAVAVAAVTAAVTLPANAPSTFLANDATAAAIGTNQVLLLGLTGHNQGIRNQVYDSSTPPNLLSCTICAYATAGNAATNDGATGLLHSWALANTYASGVLTAQSIKLIS